MIEHQSIDISKVRGYLFSILDKTEFFYFFLGESCVIYEPKSCVNIIENIFLPCIEFYFALTTNSSLLTFVMLPVINKKFQFWLFQSYCGIIGNFFE